MAPRDSAPPADAAPGAAAGAPPRIGGLAPFRHSFFRAIWIANMASNFGTWFQSVGAAWTMTQLDPSPNMVALVQAATTLPILLFSVWAGACADMWDRRAVLVVSLGFTALAGALLSLLGFLGWITPWWLLGITFAIGTGQAFYGPAWQASVGEMVPREEVPAAIALNSVNFNIARSAGPALGGVLVGLAGAEAAFLFNTLSYLAVIAVYFTWKRSVPTSRLPRERMGGAVVAGLRYVGQSPEIQNVLVRSLFFGLAASAIMALLPVIAIQQIRGGPFTYGVLLGAMGLGAVAAAMLVARLREKMRGEGLASLGSAFLALACLVLGLTSWMPAAFAAMFATGLAWMMTFSVFNTTVQLCAPNWVKARALAIYQTTAFGGMAIGAWMWGELATAHSTSVALLGASIVMAIGLLLRHRYHLPETESIDVRPAESAPEPNVAIPFDRFHTPVRVAVEYTVAPEKAEDFMIAMRDVRRIRKRNGATRWRLWHDVEHPERWVEVFELPSWIDHLRLYDRATMADRRVMARARAFHHGEAPPKATRFILAQTSRALPHHDPTPL